MKNVFRINDPDVLIDRKIVVFQAILYVLSSLFLIVGLRTAYVWFDIPTEGVIRDKFIAYSLVIIFMIMLLLVTAFSSVFHFRSQRNELLTTINGLYDCLIIMGPTGIITKVNDKLFDIFGYTPIEVVGENVKMLMPEPYHSEHDSYLKKYSRTGKKSIIGSNRQVEGRRKDGTIFFISLSVTEMVVSKKVRYIGLIRDITDKVRAEKILNRKNVQLETIAYIVRHDMVGAMDYIDYGTKSLRKKLTEDQIKTFKLNSVFKMIEGGNQQAQGILEGVREWTNVLKFGTNVSKETFNADEVFAEYYKGDEFKRYIEQSTLGEIVANPSLFCQLFKNLVGNGVKYNPKKNKVIKLYREGDTLVCEDNGGALVIEDFEKLRRPFQRGGSAVAGTGIGLAIVDGICEVHKWEISVEVEKEIYTKFIIQLNND